MTNPPEAPATASDATEPQTGTQPPDTAPGPSEGAPQPQEAASSPNREAAKYRTRLREQEAANETMSALLSSTRRREAAAYAKAVLAEPNDLFDIGQIELDDLLDADGHIDPSKVEQAAQQLTAARPGLAARRQPRPDPSQGVKGEPPAKPPSWSDVLRGR